MGKEAIVLIHGFAGTRDELKPLYDYLIKKEYIVTMPLLKGHEGTIGDLSKAKYRDWINSVETEVAKLRKEYEKIIVVGFSMGGLIGVNIYNEIEFEGLVTINTPIYYWDIRRIARNLIIDFHSYFKKYFEASTNKPLQALVEFQKLLTKTKPLFKKIKCPTLIIQTLDDDTVNPKSSDYIFRNLNCDKIIKKYKSGGHIVFSSDTINSICEEIDGFCNRLIK